MAHVDEQPADRRLTFIHVSPIAAAGASAGETGDDAVGLADPPVGERRRLSRTVGGRA